MVLSFVVLKRKTNCRMNLILIYKNNNNKNKTPHKHILELTTKILSHSYIRTDSYTKQCRINNDKNYWHLLTQVWKTCKSPKQNDSKHNISIGSAQNNKSNRSNTWQYQLSELKSIFKWAIFVSCSEKFNLKIKTNQKLFKRKRNIRRYTLYILDFWLWILLRNRLPWTAILLIYETSRFPYSFSLPHPLFPAQVSQISLWNSHQRSR